jgi:hypothetical protein
METDMGDVRLNPGDEVVIPWGVTEVQGAVAEVYGPVGQRKVVVNLTPELTGSVVGEATTVVVPLESVHVASAA